MITGSAFRRWSHFFPRWVCLLFFIARCFFFRGMAGSESSHATNPSLETLRCGGAGALLCSARTVCGGLLGTVCFMLKLNDKKNIWWPFKVGNLKPEVSRVYVSKSLSVIIVIIEFKGRVISPLYLRAFYHGFQRQKAAAQYRSFSQAINRI